MDENVGVRDEPQPLRLLAALYKAQRQCPPLRKDAANIEDVYAYSSVAEVLEKAHIAWEGTGIIVLPGSFSRAGDDLTRPFRLVHVESGEELCWNYSWPIVQEQGKGKGPDKALAVAMSSSLKYFLEEVLQMRRGGDDMDARPSRRAEAKSAAPNKKPGAPAQGELALKPDLARALNAPDDLFDGPPISRAPEVGEVPARPSEPSPGVCQSSTSSASTGSGERAGAGELPSVGASFGGAPGPAPATLCAFCHRPLTPSNVREHEFCLSLEKAQARDAGGLVASTEKRASEETDTQASSCTGASESSAPGLHSSAPGAPAGVAPPSPEGAGPGGQSVAPPPAPVVSEEGEAPDPESCCCCGVSGLTLKEAPGFHPNQCVREGPVDWRCDHDTKHSLCPVCFRNLARKLAQARPIDHAKITTEEASARLGDEDLAVRLLEASRFEPASNSLVESLLAPLEREHGKTHMDQLWRALELPIVRTGKGKHQRDVRGPVNGSQLRRLVASLPELPPSPVTAAMAELKGSPEPGF